MWCKKKKREREDVTERLLFCSLKKNRQILLSMPGEDGSGGTSLTKLTSKLKKDSVTFLETVIYSTHICKKTKWKLKLYSWIFIFSWSLCRPHLHYSTYNTYCINPIVLIDCVSWVDFVLSLFFKAVVTDVESSTIWLKTLADLQSV